MRKAAILVLVAGCGNGVGDGGADMALPIVGSPEALCTDFSNAFVAKLQSCCPPGDQQTAEYKFAFGLLQAFGNLCATRLAAAEANLRITYDDAAARACLQKVNDVLGVACGSLESELRVSPMCGAVTTGKQAVGQPCAGDYECLEGLTCIGWGDHSDGACQDPPGAGAPCGPARPDGGSVISIGLPWGNHPKCGTGNFCDNGACVAQAGVGGNCSDDEQCQSGLTCQAGKCGTAGPASAGGACVFSDDCQAGLYCANQVCAAKQAAGTACTNDGQCLGRCANPDGGGQGVCVVFCGSM